MGIVVVLEIVNINHNQGKQRVVALGPLVLIPQTLLKMTMIIETGHTIGDNQFMKRFLFLPQISNQ